MATILCLETATTNCSVALSVSGSVIAFKEDPTPGYSHAEKLHVFIEDVLEEASVKKNQLDAIAISKGPGSYTGLRIGVSAAKGLCYALDIPLISIETLTVLVEQVTEEASIIPMLDARRMEVYTAIYNYNKEKISATEALVLSKNSFEEQLTSAKTIFIGDGVLKFQEICKHSNAQFIDAIPSSIQMAALAEKKYKISDIENVAYFEPYYLKDFISG